MDVDEEAGSGAVEAHGSKIIVIHPGSQNLRVGLANDALPKTVPMVIARQWQENECEEHAGEPEPKRLKTSDGHDEEEPENMFGEDVGCVVFKTCSVSIADCVLVLRTFPNNVYRAEAGHARPQETIVTQLQGTRGQLQQENASRNDL